MKTKQEFQIGDQRQFSRGLTLIKPPVLIHGVKRAFIIINKYYLPTVPIRAVPGFQNDQISFLFWTATTLVFRNFKEVLIFLAYIYMNTYQIAIFFVGRNAQIFDFIAHFDLLNDISEEFIALSQKELAQLAQGRANKKEEHEKGFSFLVNYQYIQELLINY